MVTRVWRPGPGNSRSREFVILFDGIGKIWYRKKSRNRSRKNLVPKKVPESVSEKNWYRKKSRNRSQKYLVSVSKLPGLETFPLDLFKPFVSFSHIYLTISCQNFGVSLGLGIGLVPFPGLLYFLDGIGTGLEKNLVPEKVPESVSEKFSTEKSLGIGLEENLVPKKVSEPVSERIWYRKKSRNRLGENLVPKKCPGTGLGQIFGLVTHCHREPQSAE